MQVATVWAGVCKFPAQSSFSLAELASFLQHRGQLGSSSHVAIGHRSVATYCGQYASANKNTGVHVKHTSIFGNNKVESTLPCAAFKKASLSWNELPSSFSLPVRDSSALPGHQDYSRLQPGQDLYSPVRHFAAICTTAPPLRSAHSEPLIF